MIPKKGVEANKHDRAVIRLESERGSLQKEILEELNKLSQNPDALLIKDRINKAVEILERNNLTGDEANQVSDAMVFLSLLDIGDTETIGHLIQQWDFLYPIKIEIRIDNHAAVEHIISQNRSK